MPDSISNEAGPTKSGRLSNGWRVTTLPRPIVKIPRDLSIAPMRERHWRCQGHCCDPNEKGALS